MNIRQCENQEVNDRPSALSSPISRRSFFSAAATIPLAARPLVAQTPLGPHGTVLKDGAFDFAPQEADYNITATNRRAWQFANARRTE
jgi:hypothetical protein